MTWVDHLIFDSAEWTQPAAQCAVLRHLHAHTDAGQALGDINWTRLHGLRAAVAQFFDAPEATGSLAALDSIELEHAPGARLTALLFVGWLAVQLGWKPADGNASNFAKATGGNVRVQLRESAGGGLGIGRVKLWGRDGSAFVVTRGADSEFFNTSARYGLNGREMTQVVPVGAQATAELVGEELTHNGAHTVYLKTLKLIEPLLG